MQLARCTGRLHVRVHEIAHLHSSSFLSSYLPYINLEIKLPALQIAQQRTRRVVCQSSYSLSNGLPLWCALEYFWVGMTIGSAASTAASIWMQNFINTAIGFIAFIEIKVQVKSPHAFVHFIHETDDKLFSQNL